MVYAGEAAMLILKQGDAPQERWSLRTTENTIGRTDDNHIVLPVREVSRFHARIWLERGSWMIEDQGSRNGTFVDGERIAGPRKLKDGEEIGLAEIYRFLFVDVDMTAPTNWKDEIRSLIELDIQDRRVWVTGKELKPELSPLQFALLELLHENKGELVSREQVAQLLWPQAEGIVSEQAIDSLIFRLRSRIAAVDPGRDYIQTVRGHGFRLQFVM